MKLRGKYPPAATSTDLTRPSLGPDSYTSLGSSDIVRPSLQPTSTTMSPTPNWHAPLDDALVPAPTLIEHSPLYSQYTGLMMEEGSPPKCPTSQWVTSSSEFYRQTTFASSSNYANEDLSITGSSRSGRRTLGRNGPDPAVSMYRLQGILKRDLADPTQGLTSDVDESTMTLKERLHKNKATLRALLSEEHNPLYKMKLRTQADLNKSFENDMTRLQQGHMTYSVETSHRDLTLQTGPSASSDRNGLLQIQTDPPEHSAMVEKHRSPRDLSGDLKALTGDLKALSIAHGLSADLKALSIAHGGLTQRSLADWPQRKHHGTKRYISPDSSHDSAVDVDTTSLQSSPGSSDTQLTVIPRHNLRHRHHGKALPPGGGGVKQRPGGAADVHQVSPREAQLQLPLGGTHNNKADSDVDSGIAQGPVHHGSWLYPGTGGGHRDRDRRDRDRRDRDRRDSSSSTENDPELDNLLSDSRIQNGSRFNSLSSMDVRIAHRSRGEHGLSSGGRYGPVKADHTLQPPSPRHSNREDMLDSHAGLLHPLHSGMSASMQDLSQHKRTSPINRVRFEDEVSEGDLPLSAHHRALSHQELTLGTGSPQHHRHPPRIPSGCRAQKLRSGRKGGSTSSLVSGIQDDYNSYQTYHDTGQSEYEGKIFGLPPSGKVEDLKMKIHRLRTRAMTPTEVIHAVASDSEVPVTTNMPVHRATPVIITQSGSSHSRDDTQSYLSDTLSSENDLNNEVAQFNGFNDAWTNALQAQKSKKPRRRDKESKYDSSDNTDSGSSQRVSKPRRGQTGSGLQKHHSDAQSGPGRTQARLPDRPSSSTAGLRGSGTQTERPVIHRSESSNEEVTRGRQPLGRYEPMQEDQDTYAVPQKTPRSMKHRSESPYEEVSRGRQQQGRYEPMHDHRQGQDRQEDQHTYTVTQKQPKSVKRQSESPYEEVSRGRQQQGRYQPMHDHRQEQDRQEDQHMYAVTQKQPKSVKRQSESPYKEVSRGRQQQGRYEPMHDHRQEQDRQEDQDMYAVPQKPPRSSSRGRKASNPCVVTTYDDSIHQEAAPAIPERGYRSDLERYKELSGSRTSLSGKVESFRKAAKNKWSALRRAVSLERVDKEGGDESTPSRLKKSPSLQSLAQKFSFKKKRTARFDDIEASVPPSPRYQRRRFRPGSAPLGRSRNHSASLTSLAAPVDAPKNFRPIGRLQTVYPDGSRLLELVRPPHGPFGFYIARGTVTYGGGIFVSRLSDSLPEHFFAGLLSVGDEVLEINGQFVTNLTLDEVYDIMSRHQRLLVKTLPYMARVDT